MKLLKRLDAGDLNGLSVALGVAATHAVVSALFGETAGLAAVGGAVCASLPDVPNPPQRVLPRVLPAAFTAALVTGLVGLADGSLALTLALVAGVTFLSLMTLAWGLRAGPMSFSPVLAMVFAMAWDRTAGAASPRQRAQKAAVKLMRARVVRVSGLTLRRSRLGSARPASSVSTAIGPTASRICERSQISIRQRESASKTPRCLGL